LWINELLLDHYLVEIQNFVHLFYLLSIFVIVKELIKIQQACLLFLNNRKLNPFAFISLRWFTLILLWNRHDQIIQFLIETDSLVLLAVKENRVRNIIVHGFLPDLLVVLSVKALHKILVVENNLVLDLVVDITKHSKANEH